MDEISQTQLLTRLRELREGYEQIHDEGSAALKSHDFKRFDAAIQREQAIIDEHGQLIGMVLKRKR
jgi:hypothetical protein